jgi:hypothetical protein
MIVRSTSRTASRSLLAANPVLQLTCTSYNFQNLHILQKLHNLDHVHILHNIHNFYKLHILNKLHNLYNLQILRKLHTIFNNVFH